MILSPEPPTAGDIEISNLYILYINRKLLFNRRNRIWRVPPTLYTYRCTGSEYCSAVIYTHALSAYMYIFVHLNKHDVNRRVIDIYHGYGHDYMVRRSSRLLRASNMCVCVVTAIHLREVY